MKKPLLAWPVPLITSFFFLVSVRVNLLKFSYSHYDWVFAVFMAGVTAVAWWAFKHYPTKNPESDYQVSKLEWASILVALAIMLYVFSSYYENHLLWMDEYTQSMLSFNYPIQGSANQQQPPLGYLWSHTCLHLLGKSLLTLRLSSMVPFTIGFLVFLYAGLRHRLGTAFVFAWTGLIIGHGVLLFSFFEARPLALSFFFLSLATYLWLDLLRPNSGQANPAKLTMFAVAIFLLLNTLGLQPFIVVGILLIFHAVVALRSKNRKWRMLSLALLAPLIVFAPIQLYIFSIAQDLNYISVSFADKFAHFPTYVVTELISALSFTPWSIVNAIIFLLLTRTIWKDRLNLHRWALGGALLICLPVALLLIFHFVINWGFNPRYTLLIITCCFFLMATAVSQLPRYLGLLISLLLLNPLFISHKRERNYYPSVGFRPGWQKTYEAVHPMIKPDQTQLYVMARCDVKNRWYCPPHFMGAEIFATDAEVRSFSGRISRVDMFGRYGADNGVQIDLVALGEQHRKIILLIESTEMYPLRLNNISSTIDFKITRTNDFVIIEAQRVRPLREALPQALQFATTLVPLQLQAFTLYLARLNAAAIVKDENTAHQTFQLILQDPELGGALMASPQGQDHIKKMIDIFQAHFGKKP